MMMSGSEFYYACRNGDVTKVQKMLTSISTTEIDHLESNGSTALHAAAYYGHINIVRLLLDKGASPSQKNKYGKTPEEEAKTPEIAQLFQNINVKPDFNWAITDIFSATSQHRRFYSFSQGPPTLSYVVDKLLTAKELLDVDQSSHEHSALLKVKALFQQAIQTNDASCLLRAYTMESPFYRILNRILMSHNTLTDEERENPPWFCAYARFLASDVPTLRSYRWTGITYRGWRAANDTSREWKVGGMVMSKSFLSTSRSASLARTFLSGECKVNEKRFFFKYIVNDDRAACDITTISEYPVEKEVLILPCMDFEIMEMKDSSECIEATLLLR